MDKTAWTQALVGVLSLSLTIVVGWVEVNKTQAEYDVKIAQLAHQADKSEKYQAFLQQQVDGNKDRIVVAETTLAYVKQNSSEMNQNIRELVAELKELNTKITVLSVKNGERYNGKER